MSDFSTLLSELKQHRHSYYLWVMLAPPAARADLCAFLSFEAELELIPTKVSEEMLGLIRYAWWEESIDMLEQGALNREHPVLRALEEGAVNPEILEKRLELHRTHYTKSDHAAGELCSNIRHSLMQDCADCCDLSSKWQKQAAMILEREQAGRSVRSPLLMLRLLFA